MEVALTFGSIGDIIAICQVAIRLGHALNIGSRAAGGSSKEYQDLRRDLDGFVRILMQVVATYEQREQSPWLSGLDRATREVVNECTTAITELLERIEPKYNQSLGIKASQGRFQDIYRKIQWISEKDQVRCLHEVLGRNTERLTLLTSLAAQQSQHVDNATLIARIAKVEKQFRDHAHVQVQEIFRLLREHSESQRHQETQLARVHSAVENQGQVGSRSLTSIQRTFGAVVEIKGMVSQLTQAVVDLQVSVSNGFFLRTLDPTRELPVTLEDSLGRTTTLPAEWLDWLDWNALQSLLVCRFVGKSGFDLVRQKSYALEECAAGKDIPATIPLCASLRRGMRINMTMLYIAGAEDLPCPRCRIQPAEALPETETECQTEGCGMKIRHVDIDQSERRNGTDSGFGRVHIWEREEITWGCCYGRFFPLADLAPFQRVRFVRTRQPVRLFLAHDNLLP